MTLLQQLAQMDPRVMAVIAVGIASVGAYVVYALRTHRVGVYKMPPYPTQTWAMRVGSRTMRAGTRQALIDTACGMVAESVPGAHLSMRTVRDPDSMTPMGLMCQGEGVSCLPSDGVVAKPILVGTDGHKRLESFDEMVVRMLNIYVGTQVGLRFSNLHVLR